MEIKPSAPVLFGHAKDQRQSDSMKRREKRRKYISDSQVFSQLLSSILEDK